MPPHTRTLFQFHKGTIKTFVEWWKHAIKHIFQFHKGTIKTEIIQNFNRYNIISIP